MKELGIGVATGEHCQNRILFKQFLQSGAMQFCQIDACRMGGVNEVLSVLLMAAKLKSKFFLKNFEGLSKSQVCFSSRMPSRWRRWIMRIGTAFGYFQFYLRGSDIR